MIALSTSCVSTKVRDGEALVDFFVRLGVTAVELEYRIPARIYHQIKAPLKRSEIRVTSVHNYFPFPAHIPGLRPGGDIFSLSHPDKEIRRQAVKLSNHTIEQANALEAGVVVLHCGCVDMAPDMAVVKDFWRQGRIEADEAREFIGLKCRERERKLNAHMEGLLFSLDRLIQTAQRENVSLGLENRYHYHELPGYDDFAELFREFNGGPIGYWHDTGHAHALESLGFVPKNGFLERYGEHLLGIHLHDAMGLDDHLPPGDGEIDFRSLGAKLGPEVLKVMELKPGTDPDRILKGFDVLNTHLAGGD